MITKEVYEAWRRKTYSAWIDIQAQITSLTRRAYAIREGDSLVDYERMQMLLEELRYDAEVLNFSLEHLADVEATSETDDDDDDERGAS